MINRAHTPVQWRTLTVLEIFVRDIITNSSPLPPESVGQNVSLLNKPLIEDFRASIESITEHDDMMQLMHQYLEAIRKISDDLYKYKKLIQRKFKGKAAVIEAIHQNLMVMIMMMAYHWPRFDPLAGRVHLAVIASDMKANRHKWHSIHQQLVARIIDPEIKLVAMNMVRECRPSLDNELCWRRLMYNNHLLDKLQTLLATVDRNIPVDEVFTDSLLYWEYYDEEFICYYIEHIENSIANADSYQDKKELLTHFYNKTDLMQPTEPAFCFHIATDENDSLPPIKDFILQVLDFHSEAIENF